MDHGVDGARGERPARVHAETVRVVVLAVVTVDGAGEMAPDGVAAGIAPRGPWAPGSASSPI